MHISVEKFIALTAVLAGTTLLAGCTESDDKENAGGAGGDTTQAGAGGSGAEGGATAGNGGGAQGGSGGAEGGSGGAAGGGPECVSGEPTYEGGFDCTTLPYAEEVCPNPTGEGLAIPPAGVQLCYNYASARTGAVQVLTDCLAAIGPSAEGGYCDAEHQAAVDACEAEMFGRVCVSDAAVTACTAINAECPSVDATECASQLSIQSDDFITSYVQSCAADPTVPDLVCDYNYRNCASLPSSPLAVAEACARLHGDCDGIDEAACATSLDYYGSGVIYSESFVGVVGCMDAEESAGATCSDAFTACM